MISELEVVQLLSDLESFRVERTVATKDTEKFSQAICAFAMIWQVHICPDFC